MALEFDLQFRACLRRAGYGFSRRRAADRQQSRPIHLSRHQQLSRRTKRAGGDRSRPGKRRPFQRPSARDRRPAGQPYPRQPYAPRSFAARRPAEPGDRCAGLRRRAAPACPAPADRRDQSTPAPTLTSCPDLAMADGAAISGDGWTLRTVLTPGHTANHAAFALEGTGMLFSADHVMAWSTTIVAPPDGAMSDYMASLDRLIERDDRILLPGHGGPVTQPRTYLRGLKEHRQMRERAILERLLQGDRSIARSGQSDLSRHRSRTAQGGGTLGAGASGRSGGARHGRDRRRPVNRGDLPTGLAGSAGGSAGATVARRRATPVSAPAVLGRFDGHHDSQIGDLDIKVGKKGRNAGGIVAEVVSP